LQVSFRLRQLPRLLENNSQIKVGVGKPGLVGKGLPDQGNRVVQGSLLLPTDPQEVQCLGVGGLGLQHLLAK
jgi:hypothetical protein